MSKQQISKRVVIEGWVPDDEVTRLYKASDVGLLPFNNTLWLRCTCHLESFNLWPWDSRSNVK